MIMTNKFGLPEPIVSAVKNDTYEPLGDISVTTAIGPPQISVLRKRHGDKLTEDVSDYLWMLAGYAFHAVLERAEVVDHQQEQRFVIEVNGWRVSGKPDLLDADGNLSDYKFTSVWSLIFDSRRTDWTAQLNCYAHLFRKHGHPVNRAEIVLLLRDWSATEASRREDYPQCQIVRYPVDLWPDERTAAYLLERVKLHQAAAELPDEQLPACTPDERWEKKAAYAVMKTGRKSALRKFDSMAEAERYMDESAGLGCRIDRRPGESVRCERYCPCNQVCAQYRRIHAEL